MTLIQRNSHIGDNLVWPCASGGKERKAVSAQMGRKRMAPCLQKFRKAQCQ